jgi:hypothetical protein
MKGQTFHPVYHLNDNSDVHFTERHLILKKKRANIYNFLKICSNLDLQNKNLCYNGCQAVSLGCPPHPMRCLLFVINGLSAGIARLYYGKITPHLGHLRLRKKQYDI